VYADPEIPAQFGFDGGGGTPAQAVENFLVADPISA